MKRFALALCLAAAPFAAAAQTTPAPGEQPRLDTLLGASETGVRAALGEPDVARREDGGALWTYRLPACALFVYFRAAGREGLRVVGTASGPRRRGDAAPTAEACLAAAPRA